MEKLIRYLGALDWFLAGGTVVVGLGIQDWTVAALGVAGLGMAYLQPAKRVNAYVSKRLLQRRNPVDRSTVQVEQDEAFYEAALGQVVADDTATASSGPAAAARTFSSAALPYRGVFLRASKHNQLKVAHLQLYQPEAVSTYH